jgi:uncharacterized protein
MRRRMAQAEAALRLLGLAARAGAVVVGTERVREAARGGSLRFAIIAADASENSRGKLVPLLEATAQPHAVAVDRAALGAAVGRGPLSAVGITDASLGDRLRSLLE